MKKLLISLLSIFILFSCSKNESLESENVLEIQKDLVIDISSNTGNIVDSNSGSEEFKEIKKDLLEIDKQIDNIKPIKIYSPVYTLTGETFSGTSKVEVIFSGSIKKNTYFLPKFTAGKKDFVANFRLDYGNIEKGTNHYMINFYDSAMRVLGSEKYVVKVDYDEINVGDAVIYMKEKDKKDVNYNDGLLDPFTTYDCISLEIDESELPGTYLMRKNNTYTLLPKCFTYSKKDEYILTYKNPTYNKKTAQDNYDIYKNGDLLVKEFPDLSNDGCCLNIPKYDTKNNFIEASGGGAGGRVGWSNYYKYNLTTKKRYAYGIYATVDSNNLGLNMSKYNLGAKEENTIILWGVNYFRMGEPKDFGPNNYSVFSIKNNAFQKNYIYNQASEIKIEDSEMMEQKESYKMKLGGKDFMLDFKEGVTSEYKMPSLITTDEEKIHFPYYIYLQKEKNGTSVLHFDSLQSVRGTGSDTESDGTINEKIVKSIGIVSCKTNSSQSYKKEYTLTVDENGNYKYNISDELNNKCDIPYKINVYYKDGTQETGEYYVLFDY